MILKLNGYFNRPVIEVAKYGIDALLDTGAIVPIWNTDTYVLQCVFHAKKIKDNINFSGFGGTTTGTLYSIPLFELGDLIYPDLHIIACESISDRFQMILSATMFSDLIYEIDNKNKYFKVTIPEGEGKIQHLKIKDSKGNLNILCNS